MSAIKVNGTWQQVASVKVKRNAVWVDHTAFYSRLEGAWHVIDLNAEAVGPAYHVWKAYADDEQGNGISLLPDDKEYIGFAVGQTTEQPKLADPSIFDWSLIKGTDGEDVDPEVLNEILTKQDDIAVAVDDVESRLKAADGGLASALATAEHNFTVSLNKANALIVTTDERITDGVSRIDTAVEGLDATIKSTDTRLTSNIALADSKIASAATAIGNVQNDITGLSSLTGSHGSVIADLETITDEQAQRVSILETSDGASKARVITLEETSAGHASRLSNVETKSTSAVTKADAAQGSANAANTKVATVSNRVTGLEETSEGHASRLTNVETKSTSAVTKADAAQGSANSANTKVATVTNRVGTLEETSTGHASRLTSVETASTTAESKADDAQGTADSGVIKANAAQAKANSVDTRVTTVTNRVGTLEETSTGHASRLTNVETKSTSAVTKADDAQDTANAATTIATAATNRVSTLEETSEGHASRLSTVETKAVTAVTKADDAQGTADSGVSKANTAQAKANLATTKVTAVTNRVGTLEETSAGHASRLTNVETTATTATTKADAAQAKANSADGKVNTVTNRVSSLEETSEDYATRFTSVETTSESGVSKANVAQSTANSGVSKADDAQDTADSGVSKANAAQAKANSANTKVTAVTNRVVTLESTSKGHASRLTTVETKATTGVNKANAAQTKANSADSKATSATNRVSSLEETSEDYATRFTAVETVADSAVDKADTAQSAADAADNKAVAATNRVTTLEETSSDYATRFTSVESRAEIGVSKANTAQSTANTANSRAVDARSRATVLEQATADSAARIEEVNSNQNGAVASAKSIARAYTDSTTGILKAERVIKADANGKVSGVHLLSKGSGVDAGGKLYFQADEIAIVPPNWNGSSELDKSKFPFYFSEDRNYMYLDEAVIRQLSAETIDSGSLVVDGLTLLSDNLSLPAGAVREHMIDPAFKDGIVRVNPEGTVLGGTKSVSSTGIATNKKISVPTLKSGGSAQTMTLSVVGPNDYGRKDIRFDLELRLNGAPYNFSGGTSKIRLTSTITHTVEGDASVYRSSFKFEDQVILPAPTKNNQYTYEFVITNMSISPAGVSTYNFADKLKFSISVSEPTVSSGGFITDVRWKDVKEQPSYLGIDTSGSSSYPRMFPANNPASSNSWVRTTSAGLLPYANNKSNLGTSSWKFKEVHSVNFYENGVSLGSKYLGKTATATNADKLDNINSSQFLRSDKGGTVEGQLTIRHTNVQLNLMDSTYEDNYWQFDHQSGTLGFRYNGGDIAFRLNKGGTAAFAHEVSAPTFSESGTKLSSKYLGKTSKAASASDSDKLSGKLASSTGTANSIALRNSSGDTFSRLFRSTYQNESSISGAIAFRNSTNDNYIRFCSNMSSVRAFVDVYSKGEGNARYATAGHGHTGLSTNAWGGITSKTTGGIIDFGPANGTYAHIYTDRPSFYFNRELTVNGSQVYHTANKPSPAAIGALALTGGLITGDLSVKATTHFVSQNGSKQRVDTRNEGTEGRAHWYGMSSSGATRNFKQAWYDGSSYVNVDVVGKTVLFGGAVDVKGGLKQDGHAILNGSDTWIRTEGEHGIFFSTFGGGLYMTDATWVRTYGGKSFFSSSTNTLESIKTEGGIRLKHQLYSANPTGEGGIVGHYKALGVGSDQMIWTIGYDWRTHATHYGLSYHYGSEINGRSMHQIVTKHSGVIGIHLGMEGDAKFNGIVRGADFIATSDRRVKDNIENITDALNKVSKLSGNTYTRNDQKGAKSAGIIAQEVQAVLPEAVTENGGLLQVAHNGVIGLLVEAVNELAAKVAQLEAA